MPDSCDNQKKFKEFFASVMGIFMLFLMVLACMIFFGRHIYENRLYTENKVSAVEVLGKDFGIEDVEVPVTLSIKKYD